MKSNEDYRNSIDRKADKIIHKRKQRNRFIASATSATVCLALIICAATVIPNMMNGDSILNPTDPNGTSAQTSQGANPNQSFGGFVLTAYAANEEGEMLTANFMSEATSVVLQPDVDVMLGVYSPLMSSVPGLPFRFDTEDEYEMQISVDKGTLCRWDIQNGTVTECGKITSCAKGDILYWSPLTEGEEVVENAIITVTATDKGKKVGEQQISITSENFLYNACVGELKII